MAFGGIKKARLDDKPAAAEVEDDLAAALRMSLEAESGGSAISSTKPAAALTSAGVGLPATFRGFYDLFAIVSHKGRSADSGHYMAWTRQKGDDWLVFDDDTASESKRNGDTESASQCLKVANPSLAQQRQSTYFRILREGATTT